MNSPLLWSWLGRVPYSRAAEAQRERRRAIIAGEAPEVIWMLEHPVTVSTGRRRIPDLPEPAVFEAAGVALHSSERGGLATWHGPGQIVAYIILDLPDRGFGVRIFVERIEAAVINWLSSLGVPAKRRAGCPGVWAAGDKLCAIGVHVRRGVTMHGLALNLAPTFEGSELIVPCGIPDAGLTSVERVLGWSPSPEEAAPGLAEALAMALTGRPPGSLDGAKPESYKPCVL